MKTRETLAEFLERTADPILEKQYTDALKQLANLPADAVAIASDDDDDHYLDGAQEYIDAHPELGL